MTRRNLLVGGSGLLLFGCGDSESYTAAKDYYPVTSRYIFHWGKNSSIIVNSNFSGIPSGAQVNAFESGVNSWSTTLQEIGISTSISSISSDVRVNWLTQAEMLTETGSSNVLGFASTNKNIYMRTDLTTAEAEAVAAHEFGHMLGIWSHSFDSNDLMYPYLNATSLSNRDKRTLVDFLYELSPDFDLHDVAGPLVHSLTGVSIPHYVSSLTTNGCQIHTSTG